ISRQLPAWMSAPDLPQLLPPWHIVLRAFHRLLGVRGSPGSRGGTWLIFSTCHDVPGHKHGDAIQIGTRDDSGSHGLPASDTGVNRSGFQHSAPSDNRLRYPRPAYWGLAGPALPKNCRTYLLGRSDIF